MRKSTAPAPAPGPTPPGPAEPPLSVVLTCGSNACRHTFEPDPAEFASANLACPSCGGWTFHAALVEPVITAPDGEH